MMNKLKRYKYILGFLALVALAACTDDILPDIPDGENGKGIGEMVLFTSGNTNSNVVTRADGDGGNDDGDNGGGNNNGNGNTNETPGITYFMPKDYRFVCRMYYKASTSNNAKYDVKGGTDVITWLKVGDDEGHSFYWRNTFPVLDPSNSSLFDTNKNDIEATCLYWQNRKEHAFLAWTDLNRAKEIGYQPIKFSNSLKFVPADVNFEKHSGEKVDQWVDAGYEVHGVSNDFTSWQEMITFVETGDNYDKFIKGKVPSDVDESDYDGQMYLYGDDLSCRYSEVLANTTEVDPLHKKYGWIQYNIYSEKQEYTGTKTEGGDIKIMKDDNGVPVFLYNTATNKYLAEIEIKFYKLDEDGNKTDEIYTPAATDLNVSTSAVLDKATVQDGDNIKQTADGQYVAICRFEYNQTDEYGNVKYNESTPLYTFYCKKLMEMRNQERVEVYAANEFDLTRGTKQSINEQPDIALALTKREPLGATQESNRVNLYFKHQFSLVQVNVKSSSDLSVVINKKNIQKVELLGVTEKGYVFTELNEDGEVENANYESVNVSKYTEEELQHNQYGTAFEMFDMATGKDENGYNIPADDNTTHDAGYPTGYMKAYNGIAFGQLQAIRITWNESEDGTGIAHESTFKVTNETLKNLKSGRKYIWNIELRRGTLAIVRTEIVDWIVNGEGGALEYGTSGTISN